jgi:serine/threonine-protein kinase
MDRTEVSNIEYADFVRETNHSAPAHWIGNKPPFGQENWPVVNVTFADANDFAAWRSKRDP